jgi:ribonuclease HI
VITKPHRRLKIFFDGGCRPNPGQMEFAVVVGGVVHIERDVGYGSSMDAEWLALLYALRLARNYDTANVVLLGDSAAVINQANGAVKARDTNVMHLTKLHGIMATMTAPRIRYIKRSQNLAGIALSRR